MVQTRILDEATDTDLVEGLVATVRYTLARYRQLLAQKSLLIVLAGTGLDLIQFPTHVGASLITLTTPNGTFARVLSK